MKTPRVSDFDPNTKSPSLKSSMEDMPAIEKPFSSAGEVKSDPVRVVPPVLGVPPLKRVMKQRHPFDIYRDQYEALQALALEERKQGGLGSMSAMVREALDTFIASKNLRKQ